jgi:hypothetical protein
MLKLERSLLMEMAQVFPPKQQAHGVTKAVAKTKIV